MTYAPILPVCHSCKWSHPCVLAIRDAIGEQWPHRYRERSPTEIGRIWIGGQLLPIRIGL